MKNTIQITIPKPCHENWQQMTIVDKGRFCSSCQKKVIDFTNISDREIVNIFLENDNLCGRFSAVQLNRDIFTPKEKSSIWMAASAAVVSFFTIGNQEIVAQEVAKTEQTDVQVSEKNSLTNDDEIEVSGKILSDSQEIFESTVFIKIKGTSTEFKSNDGKFAIKLKKGQTAHIYSADEEFEDRDITFIENNDNFTVFLEKNQKWSIHYLGGAIAVGVKINNAKKRTFFGRIFHKIGNWFK